MINVGDNIRRIRLFKNLSREEVAEKLGLSLSGYSKIEQGQSDLTISRIEEIAKILDVDTAQILNLANAQAIYITTLNSEQGVVGKTQNMHNHPDEYREKYIKNLEAEVARLKKALGES